MREFKNAKELLALCSEKDLPISEIMRQREIIIGEMQEQEVNARMTHVLEIMKEAAFSPIKHPVKSMGGLIGGESKKLFLHQASGKGICGELLEKAITYAMATLETNASMGLIVASPTAGSAGIVPGLLLALQEVYNYSDKYIQKALFNAGAISAATRALATPAAFRFWHGYSTRPPTGSQTSPSIFISTVDAAWVHCRGVPPSNSVVAEAAMAAATPVSA